MKPLLTILMFFPFLTTKAQRVQALPFMDSLNKNGVEYILAETGCTGCPVSFGEKFNRQDEKIEAVYILYKEDGHVRFRRYQRDSVNDISLDTSTLFQFVAPKEKLFYKEQYFYRKERVINSPKYKQYVTSGSCTYVEIHLNKWHTHTLLINNTMDYHGFELLDKDWFEAYREVARRLVGYGGLF